MSDLETYTLFQRKIESLANRWVKAWPDSGYRGGASNVRLSHNQEGRPDKILFYANYVDGIGREGSMDLKYLDDSMTLEYESKRWYDEEQRQRNERFEKINALTNEIRNSPAGQQLSKLGQQILVHEYYIGNSITHPFRFY